MIWPRDTLHRRTRRHSACVTGRAFRSQWDRLEERTLLSIFIVNSVSDLDSAGGLPAGQESLRQAIEDVNADPGTAVDTIDFNIPGSGVQTILPQSQLPVINHPVIIDGYSQSKSSPNSLPAGDTAVLLIDLNGSQAGPAVGLWISAGNSKVMGLAVHSFESYGIYLTATGGDVIEGNFIGTDPTGKVAEGNSLGVAVSCDGNRIGTDGNGSSDIPEGTSDYAERNVVSANDGAGIAYGIDLGGNNNIVAGNYVGTDASGTLPLGNIQEGVIVIGSQNRIGVKGLDTDAAAERNLISGNEVGVGLQGDGENVVAGNLIGTDATGSKAIGNTYGVTIDVSNGNLIGTSGNDGAGDAYERNVISGNTNYDVGIAYGNDNTIAGNNIGTSETGGAGVGVAKGSGVFIFAGVANTIGGLTADDSNLICNNGTGIQFNGGSTDTQNVVEGNNIGYNPGPVGSPAGNGEGVLLSGVGNTIGEPPQARGTRSPEITPVSISTARQITSWKET